VARNKDEVSLPGACIIPLEPVLYARGFAVLVNPEEGDIQVISREFEVVGITTKEGDLFFGSKDESNVRIPFVPSRGGTTAPW
jgi:hypothetical protein